MKKFDQALLGFDARELFVDANEAWNVDRRSAYLLRADVEKPLSADVAVWPSLFGEGMREADLGCLQAGPGSIPVWRGPNQTLWDDLSRMRESLGSLVNVPHVSIAVAWVSSNGFINPGNTGPFLEAMAPSEPGPEALLLGYDVADSGLTSGLSNCAYDVAQREILQATWKPHLNRHHLFEDVAKADGFRQVAEARVPEHAPFFVFALWAMQP